MRYLKTLSAAVTLAIGIGDHNAIATAQNVSAVLPRPVTTACTGNSELFQSFLDVILMLAVEHGTDDESDWGLREGDASLLGDLIITIYGPQA
jgi:hypothetical protein